MLEKQPQERRIILLVRGTTCLEEKGGDGSGGHNQHRHGSSCGSTRVFSVIEFDFGVQLGGCFLLTLKATARSFRKAAKSTTISGSVTETDSQTDVDLLQVVKCNWNGLEFSRTKLSSLL